MGIITEEEEEEAHVCESNNVLAEEGRGNKTRRTVG